MGTMIERISLLEKKYSRVSVLKADFNIMKMWIECQFGIVFPKGKDDASHDDDKDDENPFYELEVMRHRVAMLEAKLHSLESNSGHTSGSSSGRHANFSSAVALALKKPVTNVHHAHRKYLTPNKPSSSNAGRPKAKPPVKKIAPKPTRKMLPPPKLTPIVQRAASFRSSSQPTNRPPPTLTEIVKIMEDSKNGENFDPMMNNSNNDTKIKEEQPSFSSNYKEKDEFSMEMDSGAEGNYLSQDEGGLSPPKLDNFSSLQDRSSPDDDQNLSYMSNSSSQSPYQSTISLAPPTLEATPEKVTAVTYTTRGRRHVVPRRYAEYTPHTNVKEILKKQKVSPAPKRVVKVPEKVKEIESPINSSAAGPACVRELCERIESIPPDSEGLIPLSPRYPHVLTEQKKLLIIIQKSGGKATRLTRKVTTLIFEDAVLASASPFGTKYYKDRLDPDRLEAIVDFILTSDFEQNFDEKKVYNIVAQVCNEARAGRVKKIIMIKSDTID